MGEIPEFGLRNPKIADDSHISEGLIGHSESSDALSANAKKFIPNAAAEKFGADAFGKQRCWYPHIVFRCAGYPGWRFYSPNGSSYVRIAMDAFRMMGRFYLYLPVVYQAYGSYKIGCFEGVMFLRR